MAMLVIHKISAQSFAGPGRLQRAERWISRPPMQRRSARHKERAENHNEANERRPERKHVQDGERHVGRSNLNRQEVITESALRRGRQHEEHHDGAVHGQQGEICLRLDLADHWQYRRRPDHVDAHQKRQKHPDKHRRERQEEILNADDFVIEAENVFPNETLRSVRVNRSRGRHLLFLRLPCRQPLVEILLADDVDHAVHLVVTKPAQFGAGNFIFANRGRLEVHVNVQAGHRVLLETQVRA